MEIETCYTSRKIIKCENQIYQPSKCVSMEDLSHVRERHVRKHANAHTKVLQQQREGTTQTETDGERDSEREGYGRRERERDGKR